MNGNNIQTGSHNIAKLNTFLAALFFVRGGRGLLKSQDKLIWLILSTPPLSSTVIYNVQTSPVEPEEWLFSVSGCQITQI